MRVSLDSLLWCCGSACVLKCIAKMSSSSTCSYRQLDRLACMLLCTAEEPCSIRLHAYDCCLIINVTHAVFGLPDLWWCYLCRHSMLSAALPNDEIHCNPLRACPSGRNRNSCQYCRFGAHVQLLYVIWKPGPTGTLKAAADPSQITQALEVKPAALPLRLTTEPSTLRD